MVMANGIVPLTRLPAWQALETHYSKIRRVHLRKLFADDVKRGERMATEAVGIYFDYNWRWAGVPFYIRTGKCLPVNCTEVLVELKAPPCSSFSEKMEWPNYVRLRLGPDVAIAVGVRSKARGEAMACQDRLIDRAGGWHQPQPAPPRRSS